MKLAEVLPKEDKALIQEVEEIFDLTSKFERLIEVSVFDVLYAYLSLLLTLWEFTCPIPQEKVVFGVISLLLYHLLLIFLSARLYIDADRMRVGSLNDVKLRFAGLALRGRAYLNAHSLLFAFLAAMFTAVSRKTITGEF